MKATSSRILLLGLFTILFLSAHAQNLSYTTAGGLKMGFGLGYSSQASDIENSKGGGFDYWLGTAIYQQDNAFFALDWRFRFLAGYNRAYDHRVNPDGNYDNIQLTHFNYDLELALTLNRLRERTRIILSGFAGAGITHGITSADLLDASNSAYDYSSILPNREPSEVLDDLYQLTDQDFETRLVNKAAVLPTAGIYLGYQFTPHFAMGLEHKMNFSLSENNNTFGIDMDDRILEGSSLDWNNYTSVIFKWALGRISGQGRIPASESHFIPAREVYPPQVEIVEPHTNPYETSESNVKVEARVLNIAGKENIKVTMNGQNQDFLYYSSINRIVINTDLRMGSNSLDILCQNEAGSDSDNLILVLRTPSAKNPPELKFINPPSAIQVEQESYTVKIQSSNIASREDLTLLVNGKGVYDFDYDNNGIITLNIHLNDGRNEITVSGKNIDGTASDRTNITYVSDERGFPPAVNIVRPYAARPRTYESEADIQAEISNVELLSDINLTINGINTNDFSFNRTTKRLIATIPLNTGTTRIHISARNRFGSDSDSRIIVRETPYAVTPSVVTPTVVTPTVVTPTVVTQPVVTPPVETRTVSTRPVETRPVDPQPTETRPCPTPVISFSVTETETSQLRGRVRNVQSRDDILLSVNGRPYDNFRYSPSTREIQASLNFNPGTHTIVIDASNECGSDRKSKTISIAEPCVPPTVNFTILKVSSAGATHQLNGKIENVKNKNQVTLTVNGRPSNGFQFVPSTGVIRRSFRLNPGSHTIMVSASNECGNVNKPLQVQVEEREQDEPVDEIVTNPDVGWVRINPGNAPWEFCLQTTGATYDRTHLSTPNFSYSGSASSLFIKPIAGGGTAKVNGKAYNLNPGQYYLFRGTVRVQVTNSRRGAMGQWSVYIESGTPPSTGKGNNRPKSPCESGGNRRR